MSYSATSIRLQNRICRALIRIMGWTLQGGVGGHYRPIALVMPHAGTWKASVLWKLFRWSLADRNRIHFIVLPAQPELQEFTFQLKQASEKCTWLSCIGLDHRHRIITVHRPFQFGPYPARESNYLLRYLGYFEGKTMTSPVSPTARAAEREGY